MKIIIDCNSIWELQEIKNQIKLWWYKWEICVYNNEKLIEQIELNTNLVSWEVRTGFVQIIMWCKVVNKFHL